MARDDGPRWPNPLAIVLISTIATQQYGSGFAVAFEHPLRKHDLRVSNIVSLRIKPNDISCVCVFVCFVGFGEEVSNGKK